VPDPDTAPVQESSNSKDFWDKADIIGKLLSGIALAVIALLVNCHTQHIEDSLKNGQLTQSLIDTILKQDKNSKRDLALIALDETIGATQRDLVCRVGAQVAENGVDEAMAAPGSTGNQQPQDAVIAVNKVARQIVRNRACPPDFLTGLEAKDREFVAKYRPQVYSQPDPSAASQTASDVPAVVPALIKLITKPSANTVYVQYRDDWTGTDKLKDLHDALEKHGFSSPRRDEKIGRSLEFKANVRYFYADDAAQAQAVQSIVKSVLGKEYKLVPIVNSRFQPPHGQIEVWCSPDL
jgi:hypothetical protein